MFSDYVIASALAAPMTAGSAPIYATAAGFAEVCIGLYPLIVGGAALSSVPPPGGPPLGPAPGSNYNQSFANFLTGSSGIVAWALVGPPKCDGLIVVAGSPNLEPPRLPKRPSQYHYTQHYQTIARLNAQQNQAIVDALVAIGASAAVAMDGSDSVMLGEHSEAWFSPGFLKKVWLRYGFSCGGN